MAWLALFLAGLFEIGWPLGLKFGWGERGLDAKWIAFAAVSMTVPGVAPVIAKRTIPLGTA